MDARDAVREMVGRQADWTQGKLAAEMGLSRQAMSGRMREGSMRASFLADAARAMGYRLVILPPGSGPLPRGTIEVDGEGRLGGGGLR